MSEARQYTDGVPRIALRIEHAVDVSAVAYAVAEAACDRAYQRAGDWQPDVVLKEVPRVSRSAALRELRQQLWLYGRPDHWGELPVVAEEWIGEELIRRPVIEVEEAAEARALELWPELKADG